MGVAGKKGLAEDGVSGRARFSFSRLACIRLIKDGFEAFKASRNDPLEATISCAEVCVAGVVTEAWAGDRVRVQSIIIASALSVPRRLRRVDRVSLELFLLLDEEGLGSTVFLWE